jgi:hypothetical protein
MPEYGNLWREISQNSVHFMDLTLTKSQSWLFYWLTVSQSVYLGVEPTLGLVTRYYFLSEGFCLKVAVLFLWGALSDERTGVQFAVKSLNGPSRAEPVTILYCLIWDSPNLEAQVPVFISPRNRAAQLYCSIVIMTRRMHVRRIRKWIEEAKET